jgi:uncharacterized protein
MRLTPKEVTAIQTAFRKHFGSEDHLWLFGSRADDTKYGGDIDLYVETQEVDLRKAQQKRTAFTIDLHTLIGDQHIDVVIHQLKRDHNELIYDIARKTGIQLV